MFRMMILVVLTQSLIGCWFLAPKMGNRTELLMLAEDLSRISDLMNKKNEPFVWLGLRDSEGSQTLQTRAIEDYIISSLVQRGSQFVVSTENDEKWSKDEIIRASDLIGYSVGGRVTKYGNRTYVRLFLLDEDAMIVDSVFQGVYTIHIEDEVNERSKNSEIRRSDLPLDVDLHWVVLRNKGGVRESIVLKEGVSLESGDQLQIRYRVSKDVKVYAFLFSNEGEIESLVNESFMYSGLLHYGPAENDWIDLIHKDRVYTAYFLAGPLILEENKNEFIENLLELVDQGQMNEFTGLDKQDQTLIDFITRAYESEISVDIIRGSEIDYATSQEVFIYSDGTRVQSYAEQLNGVPLILRAVSFRVR